MGFRDWLDTMKGLPIRGSHQYSALPENVTRDELGRRAQAWADRHRAAVKITLVAMLAIAAAWFFFGYHHASGTHSHRCDTPESGFQCHTDLSHSWGQYSPMFSVPSEISPDIPQGCQVTFAQVLSRHGARDPTSDKTEAYARLIDSLHANVTKYGKRVDFIRDYNYTLGADLLTGFGKQQLVNSGIHFYRRYAGLARAASPFVRSAGQQRVVDSAEKWTEGFHQAREADESSDAPDAFPYDILAIPEGEGVNNTLNNKLCTAYEQGPDLGKEAQLEWVGVFAPPITERLNRAMPGAGLSDMDTVHLMDLCPFNVVASGNGDLSPFCGLFTTDEWHSYDYYQTLGKWYGYTNGSPLAPSRGVGFVNELIARLTGAPVADRTSTNSTLDGSGATFPLGRALYADFSHDNDMGSIYAALGLYNATATELPRKVKAGPRKLHGYSASWAVPFAARMYVEKLSCGGGEEEEEELVRVLVNDRVIPLQGCGADALGRCRLGSFVDSLSFARGGGHWDQCFT